MPRPRSWVVSGLLYSSLSCRAAGWILSRYAGLPHSSIRAARCSMVATETKPGAAVHPSKSSIKRSLAYLHGFLSGPHSYKGTRLKEHFLEKFDNSLHLLDLNGEGGPAGIRYSGALERVKAFYDSQQKEGTNAKLTLIGSSLGGYVAARYAELYPDHVEKLVLFCPGFDLHSRWPIMYGDDVLRQWEETGYREFEASGRPVRVSYDFVRDGLQHPPYPRYKCPTLILHGLEDDVVPPKYSVNAFERCGPFTTVMLVDDDHALAKPSTLALAYKAIADFLDLTPSSHSAAPNGVQGASSKSYIEVEQKLPLPDPAMLHEALTTMGGHLKAKVLMTDIYWDLPEAELSVANVFLRQRGGLWELKVPAVVGERPHQALVSCYREIMGQREIAAWLLSHLPHLFKSAKAWDSLESMLAAAGATPLAEYSTERTKYVLDDFVIDCDVASFGHNLLEIELMVEKDDEMLPAKQRITELASRLGLDLEGTDVQHRGKLEAYLAKLNPNVFKRLYLMLVEVEACRVCSSSYASLAQLRVTSSFSYTQCLLHGCLYISDTGGLTNNAIRRSSAPSR